MKFKSLMFFLGLLCTIQIHAGDPSPESINLWYSLTDPAQYYPPNMDPETALQNYVQTKKKDFNFYILDFKIHDTNTFLLHEVVEKNKIDSVKWIFKKITNEKTKHELVLKQNSDNNTALHLAYQQGNTDIDQYILQQITDKQTKEKLFQ